MNWLLIVLTVSSILLIVVILLQKVNADGTGTVSTNAFTGRHNKRGLEKTMFKFTILMAIIFVILNLLAIFVK